MQKLVLRKFIERRRNRQKEKARPKSGLLTPRPSSWGYGTWRAWAGNHTFEIADSPYSFNLPRHYLWRWDGSPPSSDSNLEDWRQIWRQHEKKQRRDERFDALVRVFFLLPYGAKYASYLPWMWLELWCDLVSPVSWCRLLVQIFHRVPIRTKSVGGSSINLSMNMASRE